MSDSGTGRRQWLGLTAAIAALVSACRRTSTPQDSAQRALGKPVSPYGERSPFETEARFMPEVRFPEASTSLTPLQDSCGILTPSSLHYERHHSGVPRIDPASHQLLIHGLVDCPTIFSLEDIKRLPSISRIYFLECSGNTRWIEPAAATAQQTHGLASCSEWTGVPLSLLLSEVGVQKSARWILAEGADACKMQRSLPVEKAMDDILVAWGQNGEALRPEQGYPLRLLAPGWEGNVSVKWLRRIEAVEEPYMTRDETARYTDLMPDGSARMFTFVMDAKSIITYPSGGQRIKAGFCEVTGLAWSGRARVRRVEVSVDGGNTWIDAKLQEPVLDRAFVRFRLPWRWDGGECRIQSRATDESGYVQPSREELIAIRGVHSDYHNNAIKVWKIAVDGQVSGA
ncbi:MAG TPA: sulfite dehydrogenase [Verrucomicrobiae bacterium]|nr:sulfite dehydrogenase [Verrucomicrobiae bacterium]